MADIDLGVDGIDRIMRVPLDQPEIDGLWEASREPFRRPHLFMGKAKGWNYLKPEWTSANRNGVRLRIYNGGREAGGYYNRAARYCLGVAAVQKSAVVHYVYEYHQPDASEIQRIAMRFTPVLGELAVAYGTRGQLTLADEEAGAQFAEADVQDAKEYLEYLSHLLSGELTRYSRYQKPYRLPPGKNSMSGTQFVLPIFANRGAGYVDKNDNQQIRAMQKIVWYGAL